MANRWPYMQKWLLDNVKPVVAGPPALAFLPALSLAAYWFGGEGALVVLTALLPVIYLVGTTAQERYSALRQSSKGAVDKSVFQDVCANVLAQTRKSGTHAVAFKLAVDDFDDIAKQHGDAAAEIVQQKSAERIISILRKEDSVTHLGDAEFAICTEPVRFIDLEGCIQIAGRLLAVIEEPVMVGEISIYVTASVGFCPTSKSPGKSAKDWQSAAATALKEAAQHGPSSIRAFSDQMRHQMRASSELREEVVQALSSGQIHPWFQPQISTDTGRITGFEALARWSHPDRGMISPAEFLPVIEQAGLLERLAEKMMAHSFKALKAWDDAGVDVPQIGVNFAGSELSNPRLLEKIRWELDRYDLTPDRLSVEVLETVVSDAPDDTITRNINALGKMGCRIDLDDFGTGHASIASIRRFAVSRIKIDRSFVMKADKDPEQQRMIAAILTMAERLEVETLAEGVETVGEHVLLAQLGCDHVQGYGIARPMPLEQTLEWIHKHNAKLQDVPSILQSKST